MATVVCVRFSSTGKVYYFEPGKVWPQPGEQVVVETVRGAELGEVVAAAREISDESVIGELKPVLRRATEADLATAAKNREKEKAAFAVCVQRIKEHKLNMKLVNVEFAFDGSKVVFYFVSDDYVDFRELVKDLASVYHTRIELRQIGVRDHARFLSGLGICGRKICCDAFLSDFAPVTIKMAKEQSLSLNPTKISGQCGRLMCCLKYEEDTYSEILKSLPKLGKDIMTPDGPGTVTDISPIREKVKVRIHNGEDFEIREYAVGDVRRLQPGEKAMQTPPPEPKPAAPEPPAKEEAEPKRKYPRPKKNKTLNTEQYMALHGENAEEQDDTETENAQE